MFYRSNSSDFNEVLKKIWDSYPSYEFKTYSTMPSDDVEINQTKDGAYSRLRYKRLGSSRSRIYKIMWINNNIYDAFLDGLEGTK